MSGSSQPKSNSLSGFISSLAPQLIIAGVALLVFLILRKRFRRIYEPRTYVSTLADYQRTPQTSPGMFGWISTFWSLPDDYVLNHNSLDGYLFLRYFKLLVVICLVGVLITWPVLFPVNATGGGGLKQFDMFTFGNVTKANANRYYAHVFVIWVYYSFILFVVARESVFFIHLRQAYLLSPRVASRMSSRTVCFTDVPQEYLDEARIRAIFPFVKHVWISTDCKELQDLVKDRDKTAMKLEGGEIAMSKAANTERRKVEKKGERFESPVQWVDEHKRPTHRLKPLIGRKVDTIDWCRSHLQEVIPKVENLQSAHWNGKAKALPAVFIEFETIQAAESAFQQVPFHKPKVMQARCIGVPPDQIVWSSLSKSWLMRDLLYVGATTLVVLLCLFWTVITAFIGSISNINHLTQTFHWLAWINDIPSVVLGVVTGLLPSVLLAIAMALVPIFMNFLAKFQGAVSQGEIQLRVQGWYFWFQVIQVFLVVTLSSAASAVGGEIANQPSQAPALLAKYIPLANNIYINYFVFFGVSFFWGTLLNVVALALFIILGWLLDKTPRKKYARFISISSVGWGSTYPKFTLLIVIAIIYTGIAPLMLGFAMVGFILLYVAYRYCLLFTTDTTNITTQGRTYAKALQQTLTGIYIGELTMVGLLGISAGSSRKSLGPLVLMLVFAVATILFHVALRHALTPLMTSLPRDLLSDSTRKAATTTQLGDVNHHSTLGQNETTMSETKAGHGEYMDGHNEAKLSPPPQQGGFKTMLQKFLHPSMLPRFVSYLSEPIPDYSGEIRREAYLNPAITSPPPLLWIVHDDMGVSARSLNESGKVIGVSDQGAWWDEKTGKMTTLWQQEGKEDMIRDVPIWDDIVEY